MGVLSRPGLGSRFSIYLPLEDKKKIEVRPAVLCLDNDSKYLNEIKMSLSGVIDWQCGHKDTVEDVIAFLEEHPEVDIFISEIKLPAMNGWDLLKKIKERFPLLPVILYSSAAAAALKQESKATIGPDFLLKKPFKMTQLKKIIREVGRQKI
ncbi:MAG TPA: response regulator [Deltaproteobacteria bacterium]|nr:response regulator [Deltaproteobacteria bacterium]